MSDCPQLLKVEPRVVELFREVPRHLLRQPCSQLDLLRVARELGCSCCSLCVVLQLTESERAGIETKFPPTFPNRHFEEMRESLEYWRKKNGSGATWGYLIYCLHQLPAIFSLLEQLKEMILQQFAVHGEPPASDARDAFLALQSENTALRSELAKKDRLLQMAVQLIKERNQQVKQKRWELEQAEGYLQQALQQLERERSEKETMSSILKSAHAILIRENNGTEEGCGQSSARDSPGVDLQRLTLEDLEQLAESDC